MRGWSSCICLLAACSFEKGVGTSSNDGSTGGDAAPLVCPMMKREWIADFSIDPTTQNLNGDPEPDWRVRDGGAFPGLLADGVWSIGGTPSVSLDTQPKVDFKNRTRATARMRATSAGTRGVMLWLNVDYSPMTFMPLYLEVRLEPDGLTQTATLYGKDPVGEITLQTFPDLGTGFVDVRLEIDAMMNTVTAQVGNAERYSYAYTPIPREMNDDRFATLVAYGSDGQFDEARIETCQ